MSTETTNQKVSLKSLHWLNLILIACGAAGIYLLPYLRAVYYGPLQDALGVTNTQLGVIQGFFGILTICCYFPGGWLADQMPAKTLLAIAFAGVGLGGLWYAQFPSFNNMIILHVWFGIACTLPFWAAYIKATRQCGPPEAQGRAFGLVEGIRRFVSTLVSLGGSWLFTSYASQIAGLRAVIYMYSFLMLGLALLVWFVFRENLDYVDEKAQSTTVGIKELIRVLKMPTVWLIGLIVLMAYNSYRLQDFLTPYSTKMCGLSAALGAVLATVRYYGIAPIGAIAGGFLGDRIKSSNVMVLGFVVIIVTNILNIAIPGTPAVLTFIITNMMVFMTANFAMRGVYYALLEEGNVPVEFTGTATGIIATLAYSADIYHPIMGGYLLDKFPGQEGYNYLFLSSIIGCALGIILVCVYRRIIRKQSADSSEQITKSKAPFLKPHTQTYRN